VSSQLLQSRARLQTIGLYLGPSIAILMLLIGEQGDLSTAAWQTAAMDAHFENDGETLL